MQNHWLRIIVFILMTGFVAIYFHTGRQEDHYSNTGPQAVAQILSEISSWEKAVLHRHLAAETKETVTDEQLSELFKLYQTFGKFRSLNELNFSRSVSAFSLLGEKRINYSGTANFDAGLINVSMTLVERGGYFKVYNFALTKVAED